MREQSPVFLLVCFCDRVSDLRQAIKNKVKTKKDSQASKHIGRQIDKQSGSRLSEDGYGVPPADNKD